MDDDKEHSYPRKSRRRRRERVNYMENGKIYPKILLKIFSLITDLNIFLKLLLLPLCLPYTEIVIYFIEFLDDNHNMDQFQSTNESEKYRHVHCRTYDADKQQPLKVYISFQALFLMNVHSHLFKEEIIGFLGGYALDRKNGSSK